MTDDRGQRAEGRRQKTELVSWRIRKLGNEGIWQRGQKSEIGSQREEDAVQRRYRY